MKWWHSPQVGSWLMHGFIAVWVPILFAMATQSGDKGVIVGTWLTLLFFYAREKSNEITHRRKGTWGIPDEGGITPEHDKWLDLAGPALVTFLFTVVWLV